MTRAALYIRVSTAEQVEFYGLASQQTALLKRVEERQYTLVRDADKQTFMDDGYSGGDMNRPALDRLRLAVREGQVDVVLSYDPDRLSRNLSELLLLANEIEAAGAHLEFITQEMDSSPEGKMFFAIRGAVAEYEKAKIRERTMRGLREKARQGKLVNPRNLPRWLHWNAATQQVEMDEEWTQVVRLAYRLVDEEGRGPRSIAARFMTLGIRSPSGASVWGESTLRKWLRDPAAKGQYAQMRYEHMEPPHRLKALGHKRNTSKRLRPEQEWQILPVPPVVSADVWERVQRRLDFNKDMALRNARRDYLLRGFLRCGSCGRRMTGRYRNWERTRYYRCPHGNDRGSLGDDVCRQPIVRADDIEQAVWDALARLLHDPQLLLEELGRRREEGSATRTGMERELALVRDRLPVVPREMDRLIDGYGKGLIPDDRMRTRMSALTEERSQIEEKKKGLEARLLRLQQTEGIEDQVLAFVEKIRDKVDVFDEAGRRRLLELVLEDVTCHSDHAIVRTVIPPLDREPSGQLDASPQGGPRGMAYPLISLTLDKSGQHNRRSPQREVCPCKTSPHLSPPTP